MLIHLTAGSVKMVDSAILKQNQNNKTGNKETAHPADGGKSCHKGELFQNGSSSRGAPVPGK